MFFLKQLEMKYLITAIALIIFCSCSQNEIEETINVLKITSTLPVHYKNNGEPKYIRATINGVVLIDEVYFFPTAWQNKNGFNVDSESNVITKVELLSSNMEVIYKGAGYYDLNQVNYISEDNPLKVFKLNKDIGVSLTVIPN
ncbi:hypothetical protein CEPG_00002 [Cellulophaga phage phiSM]|uniref:hypothetical protein n=1 Tax=Cellulophaga phage phiSM TaxID=756280 RepID=UPI0002C14FCE|nr:hypothetical protein CEPG_00002 [Cellulophaga phage phiSM]AGH07750.1 hypothetical protein CEPG_00002 [Cellulophaga phage phiSM]